MQNNKIESVEGIRGAACLMVFLSHLSSTFFPSMHTGNVANAKTSMDIFLINSPFAFIYSGVAAVGIFFVLSGFILSYGILNKGDVLNKASGMAIKRYFRLMPPALISCVIAFFIFKYINVDKSMLGPWAQGYKIDNPSLTDAIWTGAVTPFFTGGAPYNWSLWTMKIEFFGSMALFFICCLITQIKYKKSIILIAMLIPFFMNIKAGDDIYYAAFFSGMIIYISNVKLNKLTGMSILIVGLFLCGYHSNGYFYRFIEKAISISVYGRKIDNYTLFNNVGGFLVVFSILKTDFISRIMSSKILFKMGALSFSVYVLHQPIMHVTTPLFFDLAKDYGLSYGISSVIASIITIVLVYLISAPYHKYIDNFSVYLSNKIKNTVMNNRA